METYNTKYLLQMGSKKGRGFELRLKKKGYDVDGDIFALRGRNNPISIQDNSSPKQGKLVSVRGTSMTMGLVADTACLDAGFKRDFESISDRDWIAEFAEIEDGQGLRGHVQIDTLSLSAQSIPAKATIDITHIGSLSFAPSCTLEFTMNEFPAVGDPEDLDLYAVPADKSNTYSGRKFLGSVPVYNGDTQDDVMHRIADDVTGFTYVNSMEILYTQLTYDPDIDSTWNVKITYKEDEHKPYWYNNNHRFNGSTQRDFIKLFWHTYSDSGIPTVTQIAAHHFQEGEYLSLIAQYLVANINGVDGYKELQNVYFPISDETKLMRIRATAVGTVVELELLDITAGEGNSIVVQEDDINDTYLRIEKNESSDYTYSLTNFTGAQDIGDTFAVEMDWGGGYAVLASVTALQGTTAEEIIAELAIKINNLLLYEAYVDPVNDTALYFSRSYINEPVIYRFTTSGPSTISDDGPTFDTVDLETIRWMGWILPYFYTQLHIPNYVRVNLTAVCGLGDIKNSTFPANPALKYRKISLMEILVDILSMTGFNLDIYEAFHLWDSNMNTNKSPLLQTYIDSSQVTGTDPFKLLREIVGLLQASLVQYNGRWELVPIKLQEQDSYVYRVFNYLGLLKGNVTRSNFQVEAGGPTRDNIMLNKATRFKYSESLSDVEYTQDYGYSPQQIGFSLFENFNDNFGNVGHQYPWKWLHNGINQTSFLGKIKKDSTGYVVIQDAIGQVNELYLSQKITVDNIVINTEKKQYTIQIHMQGQQGIDDAADLFKFRVELTGGSIPFFMEDNELEPWDSLDTTIEIDIKDDDTDILWTMDFNLPGLYSDQEGPFSMEVQVLQPASGNGFVGVKFVKVLINSDMDIQQVIESYTENRTVITGEKLTARKTIGDVPAVPEALQMYHNALFWMSNGLPRLTQDWVENIIEPPPPIAVLVAAQRFALEQYVIAPTQLQIILYGGLDMRSIVKDKTYKDWIYMFVSCKWLPMLDEVRGELVQIRLEDLPNYPPAIITDEASKDIALPY